jgi:hypothetical protein
MKIAPILHIGYHKTGTTFLQNNIFNSGNYDFQVMWGKGEAIEKIVMPHPMRFDAGDARRDFFSELDNNRIPVITHEALSGVPNAGIYYGFQVADKLKIIFGDAKIIIGIREQKSMIRSMYGQYIVRGGVKNLENFLGCGNSRLGFRPVCRLDHFEYDLLISYYIKLFGVENVLCLPIEILRINKQKYMEMLLDFTHASGSAQADLPPINVGRGAFVMEMERKINHVLKLESYQFERYKDYPISIRIKNRILRLSQKYLPKSLNANRESEYRDLIKEFVGSYFKESNKLTASITGIDLQELGYDMNPHGALRNFP